MLAMDRWTGDGFQPVQAKTSESPRQSWLWTGGPVWTGVDR